MARSVKTDYLHSMRFHVDMVMASNEDLLNSAVPASGGPAAGFASVGLPDVTVETVEYKEGIWIYAKKQPGNPSFAPVSMRRGVTRGDTSFWNWIQRVIEGQGEYRADISIKQFHRDTNLTNRKDGETNVSQAKLNNLATPAKTYVLHEAFPTHHKVGDDMDATASEISIMELQVDFEYFTVTEGNAPTAPFLPNK
jgi:phage tail-like protein